MQLGWTLPFAWAGIWILITIPWVQSDLRREKKAWQEGGLHGGIPYTDDPNAPTHRTRFESVQDRLPSLLPWVRAKPSPAPTLPHSLAEAGAAPEARIESGSPPSVNEKESPASTLSDGPADEGPEPRARTEAEPKPPSCVIEKEPDGPVEDGMASGMRTERLPPPAE